MSKILLGALGIVLAVIIFFAGIIYEQNLDEVTPEDVFNNYLEKFASTSKYAASDSYSGEGSKINSTGSIDLENKQLIISADVECNAKQDNQNMQLSITAQSENENSFLRINSISGNANADGQIINLEPVYVNVIGKWYRLPEPNRAIQSQLNNSVYLFTSALMAPEKNSEVLADDLLKNDVFSESFIEEKDENYVFSTITNRTEYDKFLREQFPDLDFVDQILTQMFDAKNTLESTVTVTQDGKLINEQLGTRNLCINFMEEFFVSSLTELPEEISGESKQVDFDTVEIEKITSSKSFEQFPDDLVL